MREFLDFGWRRAAFPAVAAKEREFTVCVLAEGPPVGVRTSQSTARRRPSRRGPVDLMMRVGAVMTGNEIPEAARPALEERAKKDGVVRRSGAPSLGLMPRA